MPLAPRFPDGDTAPGAAGYCAVSTLAWQEGQARAASDYVADEVPLALEYNGISHAVMLVTPTDLEDMAVGFSLTEGIVSDISDIRGIEIVATDPGLTARIAVSGECFLRLKTRRRSLAGRTGCGLCGAQSLQQVYRLPTPVNNTRLRFSPAALQRAFGALHAGQTLMHKTGATHAAAWADASGRIKLTREDVGRHNALDKLIGALARRGAPTGGGLALVTSRASYEMVLKTAAAGIGCLAAVSAPTALAVRLAQATRLTLLGFVRGQRLVVYTHAQRLDTGCAPSAPA